MFSEMTPLGFRFVEKVFYCPVCLLFPKKPDEVDEVEDTPNGDKEEVIDAAAVHGRKQSPKGEGGQAQPEQNPVQGEEAEKAQRGGRDEPTNLGGINRVEVSILDLRSNPSTLAESLIQPSFQMTGVKAGKIHKVQVKAGLRAGGNDQKRDESQGQGAVPEQAADHQNQEEIKAVKKLLMVGVLHLPHPAELFRKKRNRRILKKSRHPLKFGRILEIGQLPYWPKLRDKLALNFSSSRAIGKMPFP